MSDQTDHPDEHHEGQSVYEDKFNALLGQVAPDFELYSYDGEKIRLQDQKGKKVVLFFTEGVMCYPSCWNQIAAFGNDEAFQKEDTAVFSIVVDTKNEWKRAVDKMPELAQTAILLDVSKEISKEYGVLSLPSSMHKGQFPGHTYLVLDKEGVIRFIKDDPQMAVRNDVLKTELEKLN
ncbi:MAG TPA: peroxiredoxin family protein [Patescibacteria group bacterium]